MNNWAVGYISAANIIKPGNLYGCNYIKLQNKLKKPIFQKKIDNCKEPDHKHQRPTSSRVVISIPRAFSCTRFSLKSFNLSATERPENCGGCTATGFSSSGGRLIQTSSTKFLGVWINFCCFLLKARSHFCAVSTDTHQGSTPMAASFGKF